MDNLYGAEDPLLLLTLLLLVSYASQASRLPHVESVSYQISKHTLVHTRTICAIFHLGPTSHRSLRQTRSEATKCIYMNSNNVFVSLLCCAYVYIFPAERALPSLFMEASSNAVRDSFSPSLFLPLFCCFQGGSPFLFYLGYSLLLFWPFLLAFLLLISYFFLFHPFALLRRRCPFFCLTARVCANQIPEAIQSPHCPFLPSLTVSVSFFLNLPPFHVFKEHQALFQAGAAA